MLKQKSIIAIFFFVLFSFGTSIFAQDKSSSNSDTTKGKSKTTCDSKMNDKKDAMSTSHSKMTDKKDLKKEVASVTPWNKVCPVMGEEVDPDAPTTVYKDKVIGFCCAGCEKKFAKDPERYMKNLSEDGTKFLATK